MERIQPPDWKLLCVARNHMEAMFIRGRLESADIRVGVAGESMAELYGLTFGDLAEVNIYVPLEQLVEARQLLEAEMAADDDNDAGANRADDDHADAD